MPVVCRYAGPRGSGQYCAPRHQAARRRRSSARRLATLPSMNSSPIRTDIPPTRSGSTITLRWISCPYAAARTAASRSRCSALSAMATRTTAIRRSRHCAASRAYSVRLASRLRPLGCTAAWLIRYRASGVALPSRSESSRPRLYSAGTSGLDRTVRSSGAPATTRPNRNSWSSRSSRWRPRSAAAEIDRTASCSAASDNSAGRDHCPAARLATRSMVASPPRPPSRSRTRPVLASTGRLPSVSARRSAGSASSSVTTAKSSSPSVLAAAADVTAAESCSLASGREARLAALMSGPRPRAGAAGLIFEILHEALHDAALSGLVLQRLTHYPSGQVYGQGAHLGPEHLDRQLAVGVDLRVRRGDQAPGLGLGLLPHLGDDLGALFLGLLAEPGGLLPGFRELLLVLLEPLIRLGLRLLGALDAALDLLGPLGQGLLDPREQHLVEDAENDQERDRADDQLGKARKQRTLRTRCGQVFHGLASSPVSITFSLTSRSARGVEDVRDDQADQRERLGQGEPDVHVGADQPGRFGLPGHGLHAVTEDEADTDAGPDSGEAIGDRAEVDVELRGGCGSSHEMCEKHVLIPLRSGRRIPGGGVAVTAVRLPASSAFLPSELLDRHPFPGPGLAIRCLCSPFDAPLRPTAEGFIVPVNSVGVQGDSRTYAPVLMIDALDHARATELINAIGGVNRVIAPVETLVPVGTMQVRASWLTAERLERLRKADGIVRRLSHESGYDHEVWQFPVILIPLGSAESPDSVVLRPVDSVDGMTAQ